MKTSPTSRVVLLISSLVLAAPLCSGFSDDDWIQSNLSQPGLDGAVRAIAIGEDGTLYIGGEFTNAGALKVNHIAKWNGTQWSSLDTGMDGTVRALTTIGTNLYAAGEFINAGGVQANFVARWNGQIWSSLSTGLNGQVRALATDGTNLYAGGSFTFAGDVAVNRLAKWDDGSNWAPVGGGVGSTVNALAYSKDKLYVGGLFSSAGGDSIRAFAVWDGMQWSDLGLGLHFQESVHALAVQDTNVYVGGASPVQTIIMKWNGQQWSSLIKSVGSGIPYALVAKNDELYAAGDFIIADGQGVRRLGKWNGTNWSEFGSGVGGPIQGRPPILYALALGEPGQLFVGGLFTFVGANSASYFAQANLSSIPMGGKFQTIQMANGIVRLHCLGIPGVRYGIQRATDVHFSKNLTLLSQTNAPLGGVINITDSNASEATSFYRGFVIE